MLATLVFPVLLCLLGGEFGWFSYGGGRSAFAVARKGTVVSGTSARFLKRSFFGLLAPTPTLCGQLFGRVKWAGPDTQCTIARILMWYVTRFVRKIYI